LTWHSHQEWRWTAPLQLLCVSLLLCLQASPAADAQQPAPPHSNGNYLGSRLMPEKSEGSCPPHIDPMYQADAIVTGTDMRQRPWGFAETLREVLVKSSGDPRLKDDPRTAQLAAHADRFVACFNYVDLMADTPLHDDQGTSDRPHRLTVAFDPAKIDALLAQLGDKPWHGARPVVVPVLLVHGRKPPPYVLSAETPLGEDQRHAFVEAAHEFGLTARIPGEAELAGWHATADRFPAEPPPPHAGEASDETIVIGTLDWSETPPGWTGKWRVRWHGVDNEWGISGVNYDAAFRNIVRGVELLASGNGTPDQAGN
jgi:uncharacterized protein